MATEPVERLVGFGRYLRSQGLTVGTGRILSFCRAAGALDAFDREDLYWAARATLLSTPREFDAFDLAFDAYFGRGRMEEDGHGLDPAAFSSPPPDGREQSADDLPAGVSWRLPPKGQETEGNVAVRIVASEAEVLRHKAFDAMTPEELARTAVLIRRLAVAMPHRKSRRLRPARQGRRFDLRQTLRRSFRTQGEPFHRVWREPGIRVRPLVLILDVSGSMAPYAAALMQFGFAARAGGRRVEVFCFGTRLTRVTRTLATRDPDLALRDAGTLVPDWEGGTRIGASLKELMDRWGQRSSVRGSVAVLCSDGLDRGEPEDLRNQMARLARLAHRMVWVNPLKGSPRYEPLARGMAAALPFVDVFLPGHNVESLEALGEILAG